MNDLEVTMTRTLPAAGFRAHEVAVEAAALVLGLTRSAPVQLRFLADQANRAACSVPLNLAEGSGRAGRDRLQHWRIAYGYALEARSALTVLADAAKLERERSRRAFELLDRFRAMTWRLLHRRP